MALITISTVLAKRMVNLSSESGDSVMIELISCDNSLCNID